MAAVLNQAAMQIARQRQASPPTNPWRLLPERLRNGIACLALALGFAALAVRPGAEVSLLQECQEGWGWWQRRREQRRAARRGGTSDEEYIRQLSGEEQDF